MMSKKNMSRRRLLKLMGLGLAGTTLAACQPKVVEKVVKETVVVKEQETVVVKEEVEVEKEVTRVVKEEVPAEQKINLRLGKFAGKAWDFDQIWSEKFMDENPNITVKIEDVIYQEMFKKCLALAATGTLWDVFAGHNIWAPYLAWKGLKLQLDDYVETHGEEMDFEDFFDSVIADARYMGTSGNLYWFPTVVHPGGNAIVGFNLNLLEEAGIEFDIDPKVGDWTIADWEEMARKAARPEEGIFGLRMDGELHPLYTQQYTRTWGDHEEDGGASPDSWVLSSDGRQHQMYPDWPRVKEALEWYRGMIEDNLVPTTAQQQALPGIDIFAAGKMVSRSATVGAPEAIRERIGDRFEAIWVPWPKGPYGHRGSCLSYNTMSVSSKTDYPDAALALANRLTSKEPALYAGTEGTLHCMARRSAWFSEELWSRPASGEVMEFAAHWFEEGIDPFPQPYNLRHIEWRDTWAQQAEAYMDGKEDWEIFAPRTQAACQEIVDKPRP
jgi:ABC-type glycerol-3-phosphate transport system substrate-binding protein